MDTIVQQLFDIYTKTVERFFNHRIRWEYKADVSELIEIKQSKIKRSVLSTQIINRETKEVIGYMELTPKGVCFCINHEMSGVFNDIVGMTSYEFKPLKQRGF